jgi:hypothetical protein
MQALQQEIDLRTQERNKLESEVQRLQGYFSLDISSKTSLVSALSPPVSPPSPPPPQAGEKREATQLIVNVLTRAATPLHYRDILKRLKTEEGFDMPGKDPEANLATRLRGARFRRVRKGVYTLQDQAHKNVKTGVRKLSIADHAKQALEEMQRPMRFTEIRDCLRQKGMMQGSWSHQGLRIVLKNHKYFERLVPGVFALKEWTAEQKSIPVPSLPSLGLQTTETNGIQPLTVRICQMLEEANKPMKRAELSEELVNQGKATSKELISSMSSALSRLRQQRRIWRPEPGVYAASTYQAQRPVQNGIAQRQPALFVASEDEKLIEDKT